MTTTGPQYSDDGRFWWDGDRWLPVPQAPRQLPGTLAVIVVTVGVCLAALVIWAIYSAATANDDFECARDNAQRSIDGLPAKSC